MKTIIISNKLLKELEKNHYVVREGNNYFLNVVGMQKFKGK